MRSLLSIAVLALGALACHPNPAAPPHERANDAPAEPTCPAPDLARTARLALQSRGHPGAVVVLDARTAEPLAVADTRGDAPSPAPPASTLKPFLALAALRAGVVDPTEPLPCQGSWRHGDVELTCFETHGSLDMKTALAISCNAYFYELVSRVGPKRVADELDRVGLASVAELVRRDADRDDLLHIAHAIGHGDAALEPVELAHAYTAMLHDGGPELGFVLAGLVDAVDGPRGSATAARVAGLDVAGKTGTAETLEDGVAHTHGWFVGHAPASDPRVVVIAYVDGDAPGGQSAAPIAHDVLSAWTRDCPPER